MYRRQYSPVSWSPPSDPGLKIQPESSYPHFSNLWQPEFVLPVIRPGHMYVLYHLYVDHRVRTYIECDRITTSAPMESADQRGNF